MELQNNHLYHEILEEPSVLRKIHQEYIGKTSPSLDEAIRILNKHEMIIMVGMATSMYGCIPAQCMLSSGGKPNYLVDAAEFLNYHLEMTPKNAAFVLVSQSGESAEIIHLLDKIGKGWQTVGVYNNDQSTLAKQCTVGLPIFAGAQLACGSKTNTATIAVMNILAEGLLGTPQAKVGEQVERAIIWLEEFFKNWEARIEPAVDLLDNSAYTVFIGRGPGLASAYFSSVLFREVPKVVAEGLPAATFRHGLREMMTPDHRIVAFAPSGKTTEKVIQLTEEMNRLGIPSMIFTNQQVVRLPTNDGLVFQTAALAENYSPLVDIAPPQLIGLKLALKRGLEPGKLVISDYVTKVE